MCGLKVQLLSHQAVEPDYPAAIVRNLAVAERGLGARQLCIKAQAYAAERELQIVREMDEPLHWEIRQKKHCCAECNQQHTRDIIAHDVRFSTKGAGRTDTAKKKPRAVKLGALTACVN